LVRSGKGVLTSVGFLSVAKLKMKTQIEFYFAEQTVILYPGISLVEKNSDTKVVFSTGL
jgi:hypothetical protein